MRKTSPPARTTYVTPNVPMERRKRLSAEEKVLKYEAAIRKMVAARRAEGFESPAVVDSLNELEALLPAPAEATE